MGGYKIPIHLAKVNLECEGLVDTLKVGVLDCIPRAILVGNDILSVSNMVNIVTCSKLCKLLSSQFCNLRIELRSQKGSWRGEGIASSPAQQEIALCFQVWEGPKPAPA